MGNYNASPDVLLGQANTWTATQTVEVPADLGGMVLHSNTAARRGQYHIDTVQTSDGQLGALLWKNAGDSVAEVQAIRTGANDAADMTFGTQPASGGLTERMRITSTGTVYIGDTANGNMTGAGVTIQKAGETDHAITLKSDVTNGFSSLVEADTFAFMQEFSSDGGVLIAGYSRGQNGMELRGSGDATDMSDADTTGSRAVITVTSREDDGSNGQQAVATGNIFCVRNLSTTRMILKEDGELHIGNTTLATLSDSWDDAGLVRAFSTNTGDPDTLIRSEWDNFVQ